jgi:ribosomal protein S18 acetylase RimI-like enzyme
MRCDHRREDPVVDSTEPRNATDHGPVGVRPADLTDAPAIAAVHVASWEGAYRGMVPDEEIDRRTVAWRTTMWQEVIGGTGDPVDGNRPWVAVAERDGTTLGFVSMSIPNADPLVAEITALYVEPAAWRHQTGSALMDTALAEATERGCAEIRLWVLEPNLRARAFYERFGFAHDGGRQTDREGWPVELRMRRTL